VWSPQAALSDVVYRQLVADAEKANQADPEEAGPAGLTPRERR
jgi:hypothetical protein